MENTKIYSKRIIAGMMALLLTAGTAAADLGENAAFGTAITASADQADGGELLKLSAYMKKAEVSQDDNGFIKITSVKDILGKTAEISPDDAKTWLAANVAAFKNAAPTYYGCRDFFFKYKDRSCYAVLDSEHFNDRYIGGNDFAWASVSEDVWTASMEQFIARLDRVYIWGSDKTQPAVTYTKTEAKAPTCTEAGNSEYYTGSDGKYYTLENGIYTEIAENSWVIDAKGHSYGSTKWTWNDDLTASVEFVCKECKDTIKIDADVTSKITQKPTTTRKGTITYTAKVLFNGKTYFYTKSFSLPVLELTYVGPKAPTCTEAGNIGYWYDAANDWYFADENGETELKKAETIVAAGHSAGSAVIENYTAPTYFENGSQDEVIYCEKCGAELSRKHVTIPKLEYTAPTLNYTIKGNAVKLDWTEVADAEMYGIALYSDGKWQLMAEHEETSFVMYGLTNDKEHTLAIVTKLGGKWMMDFSNAVTINTVVSAPEYPVITSVEYSEVSPQFRVNWCEVPDAQQYGIAVYLSGKWKIIAQDIPAGTTSYTSPKLKEGQTYKIVICAKRNGKWDTNELSGRAFKITVKPQNAEVTPVYEDADFEFSGKVYVVGDSTVCDYTEESITTKDCCGWGMKLAEQYSDVTVINLARAGRSSRSFLNDKEYNTLCSSIGKGDYLFIQFGHNDEKTGEPNLVTYPQLDPSTLDEEGKNADGQYSFEWMLLNKYIKVAQENGAVPVLVTPMVRRYSNGMPRYLEHEKYSEAMIELGKKYNIPVIDLTTKTTLLYNNLYSQYGGDATAELHAFTEQTRTIVDNSHLSVKGSEVIADIVADETKTLGLKISERLIED